MPNWNSSLEINRDAIVSAKLSNIWTGLYCWEIITSMQLESEILLGRRQFHWPLAPYLICRYLPIVALLCLVCTRDSTMPVNCTCVIASCFELSVTSASLIFCLRTIAIWTNRVVTACLCTLVAADCLLVVFTIIQNRSSTMVVRIFTVAFDALILFLVFYKLGRGISRQGHTSVVQFLFRQGLIYFVFAFSCNAIAVVFLVWRPNFQLGIIAVPPASLFTAIAACRSVRYLDVFIARDNKETFQPNSTATRPAQFERQTDLSEQGLQLNGVSA